MSSYPLSIVTPSGKIFDGQAEFLSACGSEGVFGVLGHHAPMVSSLKEGTLKVKHHGEEKKFKTSAGVLEINAQGKVLVLLDSATAINPSATSAKS